ncbi:dihydrofolate reductase [Vibrio barjaei]|uniref:dihydrofolate reductase n=1 Tax=Vibrio barjaei TaxID=1676683 RepID=UPI002284E0E7|nr:dihydrofolate reductase [Vibrio barjaei]MCY9874604.1 dihydrofolate reductase [Vibrio barjaei]
MRVNIIVATGLRGEIGLDNKLLWKLPADMGWFRLHTMGNPVVMGRKTFESIGKPLPLRDNIIITRDELLIVPNADIFYSMGEMMVEARKRGYRDLFVIGGEDVYKQMLPLADRVFHTTVHGEFEADSFFPIEELKGMKCVFEEKTTPDRENVYPMTFRVLVRQGH